MFRRRWQSFNSFFAACLVVVCLAGASQSKAQEISFTKDVRPILSDKCFQCHGPDAQARVTDLRFDIKQSAMSDLGGYKAIEPGKLDESELVTRITNDDPDMPHAARGIRQIANEKRN